ncbi:hypothetical protein LCGC14_1341230 [marine sediment metagenome]|uniref:Uncharacterized protein n=1 Tax=marine sediment metagenome TaxID=412755 RepID=A0A0F9KDK6_9ZZZZ
MGPSPDFYCPDCDVCYFEFEAVLIHAGGVQFWEHDCPDMTIPTVPVAPAQGGSHEQNKQTGPTPITLPAPEETPIPQVSVSVEVVTS